MASLNRSRADLSRAELSARRETLTGDRPAALPDRHAPRPRVSRARRFGISFLLALAVSALAIAAAFIAGGAFAVPFGALDLAERVVVPGAIVYLVVALLVIVAPARRQPWRWASAGSIGIVAAWLAVSAAYGYWMAEVENLRTPEGLLGLVLSTVGYLYASAIAFLVGAQLDHLLRRGGLDAALGHDRQRP